MIKVPFSELKSRMDRFRTLMDEYNPNWKLAVIFSKINLYYFTGTMQEGMLTIRRDDDAVFWVRRSYERAQDESLFPKIQYMKSFRDVVGKIGNLPEDVYVETEKITLALYNRFNKYFPIKTPKSVDNIISKLRSVKSEYELSLIKKSGKIHERVLEKRIPEILCEGMSEADVGIKLFSILMEEGYHGIARFSMFDTEVILGHIGFGESSIYPTYFNGPGGNLGLSPAVPIFGNREKKLKKGDLVFIDIGCGFEGYHTDKTTTYMFGDSFSEEVIQQHNKCVEIQNNIARRLIPGAIPEEIYENIINDLEPSFLENFMGFGNNTVKFLGHGIGLEVDELPVIAKGFKEPIKEGMVFALEPKKGIKGIGMVGIENTFLVTKNGGECITGTNPGLILV